MWLPLLCEKSGAIALVLPGLTAGRQAGWLAGWLADEIVLNLKFWNYILDEIFEFSLCLTKVQCYYRCINTF